MARKSLTISKPYNNNWSCQSFGKALSLFPLTYNRRLELLLPNIRSRRECFDFLLDANTALQTSCNQQCFSIWLRQLFGFNTNLKYHSNWSHLFSSGNLGKSTFKTTCQYCTFFCTNLSQMTLKYYKLIFKLHFYFMISLTYFCISIN